MKLKVEYRGGFPPGSPVSTKVKKWSLSVSRGLDCKVRLDRGRGPEGYLFRAPFLAPEMLRLGKIYSSFWTTGEQGRCFSASFSSFPTKMPDWSPSVSWRSKLKPW